LSKEERKRLDIGFFENFGSTEISGVTNVRSKQILPDEVIGDIDYSLYKDYYSIETVLFKNLLGDKSKSVLRNDKLSKLESILDSWNRRALTTIRDSIVKNTKGEIPTGFLFGADQQQKINFFDLLYVNPEADPDNRRTWFYNKLPSEKILGKSATEHPRVHFLDPAEHGGTYLFPKVYIEPATYNGWLGMIKAFIPELEICDDVDNSFLQVTEISKRSKKVESSLPIDSRLSQAPECRFEIPYDRQLMPANHGLIEGIILSTIRTYGTEFILRTMPVLGSIRAGSDNFDDTYLGAKASDPSTDNDGDPLNAGDLYYNTSSNIMRVYNGSAWEDVAQSTAGFATNGFAIAMSVAL
jgi:hypothetical protein